ncbi:DUF3977 family protein [Sutcliffiella rhizosphaerae]|uniref:DUF3977 family protein n=1 Tax=Sutcliffiella rhizosphaerae TaxID=2880967 RepID=A0ABN8ACJ7_9BACI|nr:DUF3977 family protein [Sutcliffiella rhizosphaerae]CAG9620410.1 hypothetical protein BACCIP111883_01178 [Sutcliffiella rhizosphaerae]
MKYIEFGLGNTWLVRTEIESEDGTEFEQKGIVRPIKLHSVYMRVWLGKSIFIIDVREGFKKSKKKRNAFKFVVGITSKVEN